MTKNRLKSNCIIYLLLAIGAVIMVFPFVWSFLTSFKTLSESLQVPPTFLPASFAPSNYELVWKDLPFGSFFINTGLMIVIRVLSACLLSAMAAYAFARLEFPGKNLLFILVLVPMMVPSQIYIYPVYLMLSGVGLSNTIFGLVLPGLASTFGIFLLRQSFMSMPRELEEAAELDGCNVGQTFLFVMLPLAKSGIVSVAIFTALFAYKDLLWPLIINNSADKMTLSSGLALLQGQYSTNYPELMAGSVIAIFPMIILFLIFQKQFVAGIAASGVKG